MTSDTRTIMQRLKEDTRSLHNAAEQNGFMTGLMAGNLPRSTYAAALPQLQAARAAIETALAAAAPSNPAVAAAFQPHHRQAHLYDADIAYFQTPPAQPNAGARDFITLVNDCAAADPVTLLGPFYVLEGSNMGAAMLRKQVAKIYNLVEGEGTAAMDPHGLMLMPRWKQLVETINGLPLTDAQKDAVVDAAKRAFQAIGRLYTEVAAAPAGVA